MAFLAADATPGDASCRRWRAIRFDSPRINQFLAHGAEAERTLLWEYEPYAKVLSEYRGRVLDVGGGAGLAGRFLSPDADYVVVDPSDSWTGNDWKQFSRKFTGRDFQFVIGVGEKLPFARGEFDAVISFWSLNHAQDPAKCLLEMHRVLKRDGRCLLVFEDMEPSLLDAGRLWRQERRERRGIAQKYPIGWNQAEIKTASETARHKLARGIWPLQSDHIRITETSLRKLLPGNFRLVDRNWAGGFLSWELERIA